jgi:hypothetical protein
MPLMLIIFIDFSLFRYADYWYFDISLSWYFIISLFSIHWLLITIFDIIIDISLFH